ncbi:AraC family transcriptional regulator [Archangium violaceum]|uniref:AraC family transcriptional regulator n=1 Tax=Archangium violaceum Cb vi76 TaxID=1406225 RepID=A0A084SNS9_9BACT|nr:AraC family transcriptional regulator [Archangium violaceum]KFA90114.1 AraC family transcriptional regulator [Archangium violaceum Cb vi76]
MTRRKTPQETKLPSPTHEDFKQHQLPVWVGRYSHNRSHNHSTRPGTFTHSYAVIFLVTRGQSTIHHSGEQVLRAGDVHIIPPGDPHGSPHAGDAEGWVISFHPEAFPHEDPNWGSSEGLRLGPLLRIRSGCHPVLRPKAAQRKRLERWMRLMESEFTGDERSRDEAVGALLRLVLIELERMTGLEDPPDPAGQSLARRALTFIETNALGPLSLTEVARAVERSTTHVAGVVRKETGRTVGQWILEYRMAEARRRLRGTDERVDIIAERVGYADATHFIRLFRRAHGLTPAAWRRQATLSTRT